MLGITSTAYLGIIHWSDDESPWTNTLDTGRDCSFIALEKARSSSNLERGGGVGGGGE